MKSYWKMELVVVLTVSAVCWAFLGIRYIQDLDEPQAQSASVQKVEKRKLAKKPTLKQEGFNVNGRIEVSIEK